MQLRCQNIAKNRLVFLDGCTEPRPLTGLPPVAKTEATKPEKYEPRVDIMGAIGNIQSKEIYRNSKTKKKGVRGYTKEMVKNFLKIKLAPKIKAMGVKKVIVCMDKGLAFKEQEATKQVRLGGATNLLKVWILPRNTAKYVSPLDNTLWHSLKQRVRARKPDSEQVLQWRKRSSWLLVKRTSTIIFETASS